MLPSMERPRKLYKYRSLDGDAGRHVGSAVFDGRFYFGAVGGFNDPFEGLPEFVWEGSPKEMLDQWSAWYRDHDQLPELEAVNKALQVAQRKDFDKAEASKQYQELSRDIPMFCLSETPNNVLMWSHYAQNHTGVCLEFNGRSPVFTYAVKVLYRSKRAVINLGLPRPDGDALIPAMTKSKDWRYEKEWRIIEAGTKPGLRQFPLDTLTGIILGERISNADRARVMDWHARREPKLRLRQASISHDEYRVDITDLAGWS